MKRAGIPRVGERGRKRDFHSLRDTYARIALENGAEITWVSRQLGHSSITLTRQHLRALGSREREGGSGEARSRLAV